MKRLIQLISLSLLIFVFSCENKGNNNTDNIKIETGKNEYIVNSKIDVTIENNLGKIANHFMCDNVDLVPTKILKNENGEWVESYYMVACTYMGPSGYFGALKIDETKKDTITLFNELGKFKLRYRFIVDNDTLDFDSNEFLLYGLEL